ncbi:MAG: glycosyl hydrolase family 17 [Bacteroidetes bacterium]|nr:glycosyl hydrolase family 17 [Bacteroidota bacterium]
MNKVFSNEITAAHILGNPKYQAICYGGYRTCTRDVVPTVEEIKDDLKILSAMNIKVLRTYNVHHKEIDNLLEAIEQLKKTTPAFEMYVMLGAWIDCKNAWTNQTPIHTEESYRNAVEINRAVELANQYPKIIKIIAVGNEAMVNWATSYYVTPNIILKWVKHLQQLKKQNKLAKNIWITSSDNFASWGGGDSSYHNKDLNALIRAVDYISLHTYPMHDTHYNPTFWGIKSTEVNLSKKQQIEAVMLRSRDYAIQQYKNVAQYVRKLGIKKPIHIGETGWATQCNELYGHNGSKAIDEYKSAMYYKMMREWSNEKKISCFFFEAFDECWKNAANALHSENHFGLFNLNGEAKYALWNLVDKQLFKGLKRNGKPITKTFNGKVNVLLQDVQLPNKLLND